MHLCRSNRLTTCTSKSAVLTHIKTKVKQQSCNCCFYLIKPKCVWFSSICTSLHYSSTFPQTSVYIFLISHDARWYIICCDWKYWHSTVNNDNPCSYHMVQSRVLANRKADSIARTEMKLLQICCHSTWECFIFLCFCSRGSCCMSVNWLKHAWQVMVYGWREARGSEHGSIRERSVCNPQEMHAIDHHTALSTQPLIVRDAKEHMSGKEEGEWGVRYQQSAGIWFLQVRFRKLEMTPEIRLGMMNLWSLYDTEQYCIFLHYSHLVNRWQKWVTDQQLTDNLSIAKYVIFLIKSQWPFEFKA